MVMTSVRPFVRLSVRYTLLFYQNDKRQNYKIVIVNSVKKLCYKYV